MLSNTKIKHLAQLKQKKFRRQRQEFISEGVRLCEELCRSPYKIKEFFVQESSATYQKRQRDLLEIVAARNIPITSVSPATAQRICSTQTPQGIFAWAKQASHEPEDLPKTFWQYANRLLILDGVTDPGNVGTLLRTAEAFSWDKVLLVNQAPDIYNPKVLRASMGAAFRLATVYLEVDKLCSLLATEHIPLVVTTLDNQSMSLGDWQSKFLSQPLGLVLGSEAHGVSAALEHEAKWKVHLPIAASVDSLNVAAAGAIFLYHFRPS